ncbi:MAG: HAD-IIIC family phosphatase [Actinomycetota bacterium]|nr:HAD-IIIC family phosphatase [Actinomycetota bacterium]
MTVDVVSDWGRKAEPEAPPAQECLERARAALRNGDENAAAKWLLRIVDDESSFLAWQAGARLLDRVALGKPLRTARLAVLGTYTTTQLVPMIRLAARRFGIELETYEAAYDQVEQELLDAGSGLYGFAPSHVLVAAHEGAAHLPDHSDDPAATVKAEADRWAALWRTARERAGARVLQHTFAVRPESPLGHLAGRVGGSREAMLHGLNTRLAEESGEDVLLVDCERLASLFGKRGWFDARYWHLAKQAVSLSALPLLARQTAGVLAADLGLSRKCVVLDLDNTLWGGVIGEDGLEGIRVGGDAEGEAFSAFQRHLIGLKRKGVVLAICSKNNPEDARLPFESHPEMLLGLDDFVSFRASWEPKPDAVRSIADELGLGVDSLLYVDDNPAEREALRRELPQLDVLVMPEDPSGYVRALAEYPLLETVRLTAEDARRTDQYRGRARAEAAISTATDLPSFWRSLEMHATVAPLDELRLPRAAQLVGKTNQFNVTTRRHGLDALRAMSESSSWVCLWADLRDRFAKHGVVALALAEQDGTVLTIDTLLMSCRVIGRTLETTLLAELSELAIARGCGRLRGVVVPTERNAPARDVFERHGFSPAGENEWEYDLEAEGPLRNQFIEVVPA